MPRNQIAFPYDGAMKAWQTRLGDPDPLEVAEPKSGAWTPPGPGAPKPASSKKRGRRGA